MTKHYSSLNDKLNLVLLLKVKISFTVIALIVFLICLSNKNAIAKSITDNQITNAIETEFLLNDSVNYNTIDVITSDGIVTLSGSADNILAKERAETLAQSIIGVRSIVNLIRVTPPDKRTDQEISTDVQLALLDDPAADAYEIEVEVTDGVVTLKGTVDSWQERQLSETVAKGVKGVVKVNNKIDWKPKVKRPDFEIEKEVKQRLANDVLIDDNLITVKVKDGAVKLTGTVGSLSEKIRAHNDAYVGGVNSVASDGLEIELWARDTMRRKSMYAKPEDSVIKKAVEDAFIYDPRIFPFSSNIRVKVNKRTVTLRGVVEDLKAKRAAEEDARNTFGVWRVKNYLKVRPKKVPPNNELEQRVKKALVRNPCFEPHDISVSAFNGLVTLSGKVYTSFEKNQAELVAEGINGVVAVKNNVDFEYYWKWKPDWEILEDVRDQLFWSPFVDEDRINVTVNYGIVTLTGEVETQGEYQDAEKNAYEGGAKHVRNNLTVVYDFYGPTYHPYYPNYLFFTQYRPLNYIPEPPMGF